MMSRKKAKRRGGEPYKGCAERMAGGRKGSGSIRSLIYMKKKQKNSSYQELYTGIHLENGVPCGHFTLYLCGEPDGWKLSETRMMEYLQNL